MQIWAESGKSALPICNYSQILYQFLTFTQNLKRSLVLGFIKKRIQIPKIRKKVNRFNVVLSIPGDSELPFR